MGIDRPVSDAASEHEVEGTVPSQWYLDMKIERDRYRKALEHIYQTGKGIHVEIAREALNRG